MTFTIDPLLKHNGKPFAVPDKRKLSDPHRAELRGSGLTDETIDRMLVWSHDGALYFAVREPSTGIVVSYRKKPKVPPKDGSKYISPGSKKSPQKQSRLPSEPWCPWHLVESGALNDSTQTLYIVEGEKKSEALAQLGFVAVGIPGIWMYCEGTPIPGERFKLHRTLAGLALRGRQVVIVQDNSALETEAKQKDHDGAADRFAALLALEGARTYRAIPPLVDADEEHAASLKGVDDFLAFRGADAVREILRAAVPIRGDESSLIKKSNAPDFATAFTDLGNAERLAKRYGNEIRYCPQFKSWLIWDGTRWQRDELGAIAERAHRVVRAIYDEGKDEAFFEHAQKCEAAPRLAALIELASQLPQLVVSASELDADPWALNVSNGIVDLRTGQLRARDSREPITKIAPVVYEPKATSDLWQSFLEQTFNGDQEVIAFLRRAVGYSITGSMREEVFFLMLGTTRSGKGTFMDAIYGAIGDYAKAAKSSSFVAKKNDEGGRPRPDLVALVGARFVGSSEFNKSAKLDEVTIKEITGGDPLSIRNLYEKTFEVRPQFKVWAAMNDAPRLSEDDALWQRLVRIPFDHHLPEEKRDQTLKARLHADPEHQRAILAWAVAGAVEWYASGLQRPAKLTAARDALRLEHDPAHAFVQTLELGASYQATNDELGRAAAAWASEAGAQPPSTRSIGDRLRRSSGCAQKSMKVGGRVVRGWSGVRVHERHQRQGTLALLPGGRSEDGYREDWSGDTDPADTGAA